MFRSGENAWQTFPIRDDFERNDMLLAEISHFRELVRGKERSRCTLEDGVYAMKLALAAKRSSEEKKIVRLNE